jgi:hypothetical protein
MQEDTKGEKLRYKRKLSYPGEKLLPIIYDGKPLKQAYRADFVCFGKIIRVIR